MSRESRRMAGVLLVVLPTVMIGGVSLLSLLVWEPGLCRECVAPGFLAGGVNVTTDGGGKVPFLRKGLQGSDRVARFYAGLSRKFAGRFEYRLAEINGEPGLLRYIDGKLESAQSFVINRTQICEIYMVRNPDKLPRKETKA